MYSLSTLFSPQITAISNGELGILEEIISKIPNEFFASNPSVNEKHFKYFCIKYFAKNTHCPLKSFLLVFTCINKIANVIEIVRNEAL